MSCFGLNLGDVVAIAGLPSSPDDVTFIMQSSADVVVTVSPDPDDPYTINFEYDDSPSGGNPSYVSHTLSNVPHGQTVTACCGRKLTKPLPVKARLKLK